MGLFRVRGRLTGPTGRSEDAELLVDTGAVPSGSWGGRRYPLPAGVQSRLAVK